MLLQSHNAPAPNSLHALGTWGGFDGTTPYVDPVLGLGAAGTIGATTVQTVGAGIVFAAPFTGPAAPFVALAGEIVMLMSKLFGGCGQSCVLASNDANAVEQKLLQNLNMYLAVPAPRPASVQAAALHNFDYIWQSLVQACGQIGGGAGENCINDRQQGACKWRASAGGWSGTTYTPAGAAGSGNDCWNWWKGYRDPISSDPNVIPDPPLVSQAGGMLDQVSGAQQGTGAGVLSGTVLGVPVWVVLAVLVVWGMVK